MNVGCHFVVVRKSRFAGREIKFPLRTCDEALRRRGPCEVIMFDDCIISWIVHKLKRESE